MKSLKSIIAIALSVLTIQSALAEDLRFVHKLNGLKKVTPIQEVEYWMGNVNLSNHYPAISDASSGGSASAWFNFGQAPFQGDSRGYEPFDPEFNSGLWSNGATGWVTPPNLGTSFYQKTHSTGKYYFEITSTRNSTSDLIGFVPKSGATIYSQMNFIGGSIYLANIGTSANYTSNNIHGQWSKSYKIWAGDVIQVWIDYDKNRLLMQKLGTTMDDHVNYYSE